MTTPADKVISMLRADMLSSPVDDVTIISRTQLEALEAALSAAPTPSDASEREKAKRSFMAGWMRYDTSSGCDIERGNAAFDTWWPAAPTSPFAKSPEGQELAAQVAEMAERVGLKFVPFASPTASATVPVAWHRDQDFVLHFVLGSKRPENNTTDPNEWKPLFAAPPLPKEDGMREGGV